MISRLINHEKSIDPNRDHGIRTSPYPALQNGKTIFDPNQPITILLYLYDKHTY